MSRTDRKVINNLVHKNSIAINKAKTEPCAKTEEKKNPQWKEDEQELFTWQQEEDPK